MIAIVAPVKYVLDFKTKIVNFADGFLEAVTIHECHEHFIRTSKMSKYYIFQL